MGDSEFRGGFRGGAVPPRRLSINDDRHFDAVMTPEHAALHLEFQSVVSAVARVAKWESEAHYAWAIIGLLIAQNHGDHVTLSWDSLSDLVGQRGMLHLEPMQGTAGEYVEVSYEKYGEPDAEDA